MKQELTVLKDDHSMEGHYSRENAANLLNRCEPAILEQIQRQIPDGSQRADFIQCLTYLDQQDCFSPPNITRLIEIREHFRKIMGGLHHLVESNTLNDKTFALMTEHPEHANQIGHIIRALRSANKHYHPYEPLIRANLAHLTSIARCISFTAKHTKLTNEHILAFFKHATHCKSALEGLKLLSLAQHILSTYLDVVLVDLSKTLPACIALASMTARSIPHTVEQAKDMAALKSLETLSMGMGKLLKKNLLSPETLRIMMIKPAYASQIADLIIHLQTANISSPILLNLLAQHIEHTPAIESATRALAANGKLNELRFRFIVTRAANECALEVARRNGGIVTDDNHYLQDYIALKKWLLVANQGYRQGQQKYRQAQQELSDTTTSKEEPHNKTSNKDTANLLHVGFFHNRNLIRELSETIGGKFAKDTPSFNRVFDKCVPPIESSNNIRSSQSIRKVT